MKLHFKGDVTDSLLEDLNHKKGIARLEAEHDGQIGKLNKLYRAGITS